MEPNENPPEVSGLGIVARDEGVEEAAPKVNPEELGVEEVVVIEGVVADVVPNEKPPVIPIPVAGVIEGVVAVVDGVDEAAPKLNGVLDEEIKDGVVAGAVVVVVVIELFEVKEGAPVDPKENPFDDVSMLPPLLVPTELGADPKENPVEPVKGDVLAFVVFPPKGDAAVIPDEVPNPKEGTDDVNPVDPVLVFAVEPNAGVVPLTPDVVPAEKSNPVLLVDPADVPNADGAEEGVPAVVSDPKENPVEAG